MPTPNEAHRISGSATGGDADELSVLDEIQRRVLWLATRMVDSANHDRASSDGVKVGGHQASSASLVSVMTALWFAYLNREDRVSVKPHASPVFHAIQYLLGNLERAQMTRLRGLGGLQAYPSRTKDPDRLYVDFSTGSVGHGAAAPLFAAVTRRFVDAHFGPRPRSRFVAIIGDAELDEGNIWEAIADPATQGLGDVLWIIDFNRQSLDRVVPGVRARQWEQQFEAAGWHVHEVKYGRQLRDKFGEPHGDALRRWIDRMSNEQYQSMFGLTGDELRGRFTEGAPTQVRRALSGVDDRDLAGLLKDLGGHDLAALLEALRECDEVTDRPSVMFAYTVKGWGLPLAGNPRNHSALMTSEQIDRLRESVGLSSETEWDRFEPDSPAGTLVARRAEELARSPRPRHPEMALPSTSGFEPSRPISTQETLGQVLIELSRNPEVRPYLVTVAPDVATSTNLAGFINRTGIFSPTDHRVWNPDSIFKWIQNPAGQHIELGISEMNLFSLLGQLGLAWDLSDQQLLPVGTVYDPFVCRGLDAFIHAVYSGARFVIAGTPSGITLAPEGGAHQSLITPSIGLELPNTTFMEPCFAEALDWLLCDAFARIANPGDPADAASGEDGAYYFRLSTRPIDQAPFVAAKRTIGDAALRRSVLAGVYRLVDASELAATGAPQVCLVASGAVMPEVIAAAAELEDEGVAAHVIDVTSLDRLYAAWQRTLRHGVRTASTPMPTSPLRTAFPAERVPLVTVHDAASHAMAWLGSALDAPCIPLGVDQFGQSGSIHELYELHDLLPGHIVNAALAALTL
jgi:pyruvate dehydrogenase E1 component